MDTPLLLIHFNRPDITAKAIEALKAVAPGRIWILCDAARTHKKGEAEKVRRVRELLEKLPWDCEIRRLYREDNQGCFRNIADGISWFLNDCGGEGIILEDDCIADSSFFRFCAELLDKYRDDPKVMAISGHTNRNEPFHLQDSYGFSHYFGCWGWATWARAWEAFDPDLSGWKNKQCWNRICKTVLPGWRQRLYWNMMFARVADGRRDSWAYRYHLSIWSHFGKVAYPQYNLVRNIGWGKEATHSGQAERSDLKLDFLAFPLDHPTSMEVNPKIDRFFEDTIHSKSFKNRLHWIRRKLMG